MLATSSLCSPSTPQVPPDLGSTYCDVLALHDVAVYGSLTALASLEREELRQRVIGSIGFREVLELAPEVGREGGGGKGEGDKVPVTRGGSSSSGGGGV